MPPYDQIHWQYVALALLLGALLVGLVWLAWRAGGEAGWYPKDKPPPERDEVYTFGGQEISEGNRPIPLIILVVLALFLGWALFYTFWSAGNFLH